jgi:hypothetical protein
MLSKSPSFPRPHNSRHDKSRDEQVLLSLHDLELPSASDPATATTIDWEGWEYIDLRLSRTRRDN